MNDLKKLGLVPLFDSAGQVDSVVVEMDTMFHGGFAHGGFDCGHVVDGGAHRQVIGDTDNGDLVSVRQAECESSCERASATTSAITQSAMGVDSLMPCP